MSSSSAASSATTPAADAHPLQGDSASSTSDAVQHQQQPVTQGQLRVHNGLRVPLADKGKKEGRLGAEAIWIHDKIVGCLTKDGKKLAAKVSDIILSVCASPRQAETCVPPLLCSMIYTGRGL